jgi:hypothetical protein
LCLSSGPLCSGLSVVQAEGRKRRMGGRGEGLCAHFFCGVSTLFLLTSGAQYYYLL